MTDAAILGAVIGAVALFAVWWKRRDGRVREVADRFTPEELALLGVPVGSVSLVEFTAPHCAPCRATKQVLDDVGTLWPDVAVVAVDVAEALAVSKAHHVLRAPTTFVLDVDGAVLGRIGGVPDPGDLAALLEHRGPRPPRGRRLRADVHLEAPTGRRAPGTRPRRSHAA